MKPVVIFYHSNYPGNGRIKITLKSGAVTYVRAEEVMANDLGIALDVARPRKDENVMNTHWLEKK